MKVNFSQLVQFQKQLRKLDKKLKYETCKKVANGLAAKLIKLTKEKTPVGQYNKKSGKKGGTLKKGWRAKGMIISNGYQTTVFNQVEYAPYVEYGHRIVRNNKTVGFVLGRYMLTKSSNEVEKIANDYAQNMVQKAMKETLDRWKPK